MFWAKRDFKFAEFAPYQDILEKLLMANPTDYKKFIMVSVDKDAAVLATYYVGVPNKIFLKAFDGFEEISESELPKTIDTLLIADGTSEEFSSRFKFRDRRLSA